MINVNEEIEMEGLKMSNELNFQELMKKVLKKEGWISIISAVLFLILGIIIVNHPDTIVATVSYIFGGFLVVAGIVKVISYFVEKGNLDFENYDFVYGIIIAVVGITFIAHSNVLESIFSLLVAIWLIYEALVRFTSAMKLKKYDVKVWWIVLVSSLLMLFAGIYILAVPNIIVVTVGAFMIAYAILDIIDGIIFVANVNKL